MQTPSMNASPGAAATPAAPPMKKLHARVNVTCAGNILALNERSALVQLPVAQPAGRQTTLAIEGEDGAVYVPAWIVRSESRPSAAGRPEHLVFMEFLDLSPEAAAAVRRLMDRPDTVVYRRSA